MRRSWLSTLAAGSLILCSAPALAADEIRDIEDLTLLASTDSHGTALDYDYYTGSAFGSPEKPENTRGLEYLSTAVNQVREREGADSVILLDNGDANQGNALQSYYHLNREAGSVDPMASVLNQMGYDAGSVGNHEFNYGLADLEQYAGSLDFPLLGANVIDRATGDPYLEPYTLVEKTTADGHPVTIGVLGLVTPGVRVWDGDKVQNLEFQDMVLAAQEWVPQVQEAGADVVVVIAHTGLEQDDAIWNPDELPEDTARAIAENVPGIDVLIGGHSHSTSSVQEYFVNPEGREVLYTQPGYHARFLSEVDLPLSLVNGEPRIVWEDEKPSAKALYAYDYEADPAIAEALVPWHDDAVTWVNTRIAEATETLSGATSTWEDTAILDFVGHVLRGEVRDSLVGTEYENLPVVAQVSPFSRTAEFPEGDVTIADMAGLYTFDNTLLGVKLTGEQVRDYLEHAARYYEQVEPGTELTDPASLTNASSSSYPDGTPDYALDILDGLNYDVNVSKPVGERIENLTLPDGTPLADDDEVVLAINNYRQAGGGGRYPHVTAAPVVYNELAEIRELLISYAQDQGVIDPADFAELNWRLTSTTLEPLVTAPGAEDDGQGDEVDGSDDSSSGDETDGAGTPPVNTDDDTDGQTPGTAGKPEHAPSAGKPEHAPSAGRDGLARTGLEAGAVLGVALALTTGGALLIGRQRRISARQD